jgi:hypothetical protein
LAQPYILINTLKKKQKTLALSLLHIIDVMHIKSQNTQKICQCEGDLIEITKHFRNLNYVLVMEYKITTYRILKSNVMDFFFWL